MDRLLPAFAKRMISAVDDVAGRVPRDRDGLHYLLTAGLMLLALWLRLIIAPVDSGLQYVTFFPVVTIAAVIGGYRPGLFATVCGMVMATFIFTPPYYTVSLETLRASFWSNLVFLTDGVILSFSIEAMHRYRRQYAAELQQSRLAESRMQALNDELNQEIAHRRHIEQELRRSESALKAAQRMAGIGNWEWDLRTHRQTWSEEIHRIFGSDPDQAPAGYPEMQRHFTPASWFGLSTAIDQARVHGTSYQCDVEVVRSDGSHRWVTVHGAATRDDAGQVVELCSTLQDITERKQAEMALREADRNKDEFLSMLAHELRNPLTPIGLAAHILEQPGLDAAQQRWAVTTISGRVAHITRLVDDLLDISRISRGRIALKRENLLLSDLVTTVAESMRPAMAAKNHELTLRLPQHPVHLDADPVRLTQILTNLLDNAAKYTTKGGHIELDGEVVNKEVRISVRDDGVGIAAEMLPHVFELFRQGESTLNRSQGGLGIGLCLAERLVKLHDGRIKAASDGPGKGSCFSIWLPLAQSPAPATPAPAPTQAGKPASLRILVVDDERLIAMSLAQTLTLHGHSVATAHSGAEALARCAEYRPQAILLDIGMAGMDGYETARRLRELPEARDCRLIAVSGFSDEDALARTRSAGFDAHVTKPVSYHLLAAELELAQGERPATA